MKRFVAEPHDLEGLCKQYGITISTLTEETGIPQDELRGFAEGRHALLARDRFAILRTIVEAHDAARGAPRRAAIDPRSGLAAKTLILEIDEEERVADELLDMSETAQNGPRKRGSKPTQ